MDSKQQVGKICTGILAFLIGTACVQNFRPALDAAACSGSHFKALDNMLSVIL